MSKTQDITISNEAPEHISVVASMHDTALHLVVSLIDDDDVDYGTEPEDTSDHVGLLTEDEVRDIWSQAYPRIMHSNTETMADHYMAKQGQKGWVNAQIRVKMVYTLATQMHPDWEVLDLAAKEAIVEQLHDVVAYVANMLLPS